MQTLLLFTIPSFHLKIWPLSDYIFTVELHWATSNPPTFSWPGWKGRIHLARDNSHSAANILLATWSEMDIHFSSHQEQDFNSAFLKMYILRTLFFATVAVEIEFRKSNIEIISFKMPTCNMGNYSAQTVWLSVFLLKIKFQYICCR